MEWFVSFAEGLWAGGGLWWSRDDGVGLGRWRIKICEGESSKGASIYTSLELNL